MTDVDVIEDVKIKDQYEAIPEYTIERKTCPRCGASCILRPVSSFDPSGERHGALFVCPICEWNDWGHIVDPLDLVKVTTKKEDDR